MCTLLIRATSAFGRWSRSLPTVQGTLTYSFTYSLTHSLTLISMSPSAPPSLTPSLSPSAVFVITTVAGSSTSGSYSGDNSQATTATLNVPADIACDSSGNMYIAAKNNQRIRKVTVSTGIITTIAGTGAYSYSGDGGAATSAALNNPYGVGLDAVGNLFLMLTRS